MIWLACGGVLEIWLGNIWILPIMIIQFAVAVLGTGARQFPALDRAVWFSIPFFTLPLWLALRQAQRQGEIPGAS
jgi:hypothetical protein